MSKQVVEIVDEQNDPCNLRKPKTICVICKQKER